jgi:hypothetical protein
VIARSPGHTAPGGRERAIAPTRTMSMKLIPKWIIWDGPNGANPHFSSAAADEIFRLAHQCG